MANIYFDTSALIRRAEYSAAGATARTQHAAPPVIAALNNPSGPMATSQIGLAEFHDVVTSFWRSTDTGASAFDEQWCGSVIDEAMDDIATGRLLILPLPARVFEQAMTLVTMATRDHGRKLRVWDAIHLITATGWSMDIGAGVELWTTDADYAGFVDVYPLFGNRVTVRNLDA